MGEGVRAAFGLAGGLALFLFGMENMSRALQQAAGERMRGFLRRHHPHTAHRGAGGAAGHSGAAKQLGHHGDGHRVRQRPG